MCGFAHKRGKGDKGMREELEKKRWSREKARDYMKPYGDIVACNYVPSYCYNYIQLWYDFREGIIKKELEWAKACNISSLRMFLPLFSYEEGGCWEMVREKVKHFLGLAEEQGMTVMMAFQPNYTHLDKGEDAPVLQFMPGCHRNHWNYRNADFADLSQMPEKYPVMFQMMDDIMGELKEDSRILAWDLWNEAHPGDREGLERIFAHAREINPTQPLTACWEAFELSDIITFHNYVKPGSVSRYPQPGSLDFIPELERALSFERPVLCTECLARSEGNTFESILPFFAQYHIGFYFWGLCAGSAQYHFPWDWPEGAPEPKNWFHCILYPDGTPYREEEILLLRDFRFR